MYVNALLHLACPLLKTEVLFLVSNDYVQLVKHDYVYNTTLSCSFWKELMEYFVTKVTPINNIDSKCHTYIHTYIETEKQ